MRQSFSDLSYSILKFILIIILNKSIFYRVYKILIYFFLFFTKVNWQNLALDYI